MEDAPVLRLLDSIITQGLEEKASDIHLEPGEEFCRVRYRIDGMLQQLQKNISVERYTALVSCLKLMAGMDIAEKRKPQDGRARILWKKKNIDLRVSSLPTISGESVVIRVLDPDQGRLTLEEMGFSQENLFYYRNMYRAPYGLILLTGPTGSGKTTSLYATLRELNQTERNIITIEDPVEYRLEGINQVAVNARAGMTFAGGLRSVLRQDPNIIMIGEIRDRETAEISIQAALTGHLVFSTLHTNTAAGAITRLLDMGVEPYLAASALRGVVAQRLVRKLCADCKKPYDPVQAARERKQFYHIVKNNTGDDLTIIRDGENKPESKKNECVLQQKCGNSEQSGKPENDLFAPVGCKACHQTGYRGRIAIQEVLPVNTVLKEKIMNRVSEQDLWDSAVKEFSGLVSLQDDGINKAGMGLTSVRELIRVLGVR